MNPSDPSSLLLHQASLRTLLVHPFAQSLSDHPTSAVQVQGREWGSGAAPARVSPLQQWLYTMGNYGVV